MKTRFLILSACFLAATAYGAATVNTQGIDNTFTGVNTFTQPIVGSVTGSALTAGTASYATTAGHADTCGTATTAGTCDSATTANDPNAVHLAGAQTVTGFKNFSGGIQAKDIIAAGPWLDARIYPTLAQADAAALASGSLLIISSQWDTVPSTLTSSIKILPGGKLNGSGTVAINGAFEGSDGCFGTAQTVTGLKYARPEWWGAKGDGVSDDSTAVDRAITSMSTTGVAASIQTHLQFASKVYLVDSVFPRAYVWLDFGGATIKRRIDQTDSSALRNHASLIRALEFDESNTYYGYGQYKHIKITGGFLDGNGKTFGSHLVRLIFCEDLIIENLTVVARGASTQWAMMVGGRDVAIRNFRCLDDGLGGVGDDGLHIFHGQRIRVDGAYIASGDDAFAVGGETTDTALATHPDPIRYVDATNIQVEAAKGAAAKIYVPSGATGSNWEVTDVHVSNISGTSGHLRNGGLTVRDDNGGAAGTSQIHGVRFSGVGLTLGDTTHDGTQAFGVYLKSVSGVTVEDATFKITDSLTAAKFDMYRVEKAENCTLGLRADTLPAHGGGQIMDSAKITIDQLRGKVASNLSQYANIVTNSTGVRFIRPYLYLQNTTGGFSALSIDASEVYLDFPEFLNSNSASIINVTNGPSRVEVAGGRLTHRAGAASGYGLESTAGRLSYLKLQGVDFSGAFLAVPNGSIAGVTSYNISGCKGLSTSKRGAAQITSAATSVDVTHGAGVDISDLSQVSVTPKNGTWGAATKWWVSNISGTQFRINCDIAPGAAFDFNYHVDTSQK